MGLSPRPVSGAVVGDFLDKPVNSGGLALGRIGAPSRVYIGRHYYLSTSSRKALALTLRVIPAVYSHAFAVSSIVDVIRLLGTRDSCKPRGNSTDG